MAQIQKGTTYITGDQVTAANLNALADSAILLPGAITDQTAKTVPLAADTVLIHSAADTALRKSTLTQLFANATGIPISTGVSGLGTGIATALAINTGTTGAPALLGAAGAFTSVTLSPFAVSAASTSVLRFSGTQTVSSLQGYDGTNAYNLTLYNGATPNILIQSNGTSSFAGGIISTAIGASSPSTGAFTTLSATGASTIQNTLTITRSSSAARTLTLSLENGTADYITDATGAYPHRFFVGATKYAQIDTTGLAVTGALSSTGKAIFGAASITSSPDLGERLNVVGSSVITSGSSTQANLYNSAAGTNQKWLRFGGTTAGAFYIEKVNDAYTTPTTLMTLDTSGNMAVTGTLSTGGLISANGGSGGYPSLTTAFQLSVGTDIVMNPSGYGIIVSGSRRLVIDTTGIAVTGAITGTNRFVSNGGAGGGNGIFDAMFNGNTAQGLDVADSANASGATFCLFRNSASTPIGSITRVTTTNAIQVNYTSDRRLKHNIRNFTDSGSLIDGLRPVRFDWNGDETNDDLKDAIGFIAQETHASSPVFARIGAVSVGDEDPNTVTKQWQRSDTALIPILVAELQSLRKRLAVLESK